MDQAKTTENVRNASIERLFYLTLFVAVIHAGFILWDLVTMILGVKNEVYASSLMSNLYLILIGGYAGFKEIKRWLSKNPVDSVMPEDKIIQFQRGEIIVYCWVTMFIAAVVLSQMKIILRMPMELTRTTIQSLAFLIGTLGSRWVYSNKNKAEIKVLSKEDEILVKQYKDWMIDYIRKNGKLTNKAFSENFKLGPDRSYRILDRMAELAILKRQGEGRSSIYTIP